MAYIGDPPTRFTIPLTLGADREFTANRVDASNNPVNWNATVWMAIDVNRASPTTINATVTGNQAVVLIPHATCDTVPVGTRWRMYMQDNSSQLITPIAVGTFERDDGG